jgi:uncharacterized protein
MLRRDDSHHASCVEQSQTLARPLFTTWPVITEAAWLLRHVPDGIASLFHEIEANLVKPLELGIAAAPWLREFMAKYADARVQLADATLCYLAERDGIHIVFTLDRRDFSIYRTSKNRRFVLLPD